MHKKLCLIIESSTQKGSLHTDKVRQIKRFAIKIKVPRTQICVIPDFKVCHITKFSTIKFATDISVAH